MYMYRFGFVSSNWFELSSSGLSGKIIKFLYIVFKKIKKKIPKSNNKDDEKKIVETTLNCE